MPEVDAAIRNSVSVLRRVDTHRAFQHAVFTDGKEGGEKIEKGEEKRNADPKGKRGPSQGIALPTV